MPVARGSELHQALLRRIGQATLKFVVEVVIPAVRIPGVIQREMLMFRGRGYLEDAVCNSAAAAEHALLTLGPGLVMHLAPPHRIRPLRRAFLHGCTRLRCSHCAP